MKELHAKLMLKINEVKRQRHQMEGEIRDKQNQNNIRNKKQVLYDRKPNHK